MSLPTYVFKSFTVSLFDPFGNLLTSKTTPLPVAKACCVELLPLILKFPLATSFLLYLYGNPLLALLFLITSVIFINRSNKVSHYTMKPSQENKNNKMQQLNIPFTKNTLEEEIVGQIVRNPDNIPGPETYHPVLCDSHNATKV